MTRIERLYCYIVSNSSFRVTWFMGHACNTSCEKATNALTVWEHLHLIFTFPPAFRLVTRQSSACILATNRHGSCRSLNCNKRSICHRASFFVIYIHWFLCSSSLRLVCGSKHICPRCIEIRLRAVPQRYLQLRNVNCSRKAPCQNVKEKRNSARTQDWEGEQVSDPRKHVVDVHSKQEGSRRRPRGGSFSQEKTWICQAPGLERALITQIHHTISQNLPSSGPIIVAKAAEFAARPDNHDFATSEGWFRRFRKRHNLVFCMVSGKK